MSDFKRKFIDILFEDEDDEEEVVSSKPVKQQKVSTENKKENKEEQKQLTSMRAADVLYRNPSKSVFINLDENTKSTNLVVNDNNEYQMSSHISPIFGLINSEKKKPEIKDETIVASQTNKPHDSHLDIITSPIYGYSSKEDAKLNNYEVKAISDYYVDVEDDETLNELFSNEKNDDLDTLDTNDEEALSLFKLFGDKQ